jgi:hypothetical protein
MLIPAIFLGLFFLAVLLLSIPVDLTFSYERGDGSRSRMRIGWLFGLIGKELGGKKKGRAKKPKEMKAKKRRGSFRGPLAVFRARGFSGRLLLLVRRLVRTVQVRDVDVEFQVGTGDPAETGLLFGVIGPSAALVRSGFSPNIRIEPNFAEETFEGHARGAVRVYPIKLIPPLIAFGLSPATFRGVRALRRARKG